MGKPREGKRVQYSYDVVDCSYFVMTALLKTLPVKTSRIKLGRKEKECSTLTSCHKYAPPHVDIFKLAHSNIMY